MTGLAWHAVLFTLLFTLLGPVAPVWALCWLFLDSPLTKTTHVRCRACRCEMVLVLLERKQTSGDSPYAMVKQAGDSILRIRTQCFAADKAGVGRDARPPRGRMQYVANIVSGAGRGGVASCRVCCSVGG